jgi:hypothetical protein
VLRVLEGLAVVVALSMIAGWLVYAVYMANVARVTLTRRAARGSHNPLVGRGKNRRIGLSLLDSSV